MTQHTENTSENFATWLTKPQAAQAIGVSTKTVEKLASDGRLRAGRWRRDGRGAAFAVYHPADVENMAEARRGGTVAPFVVETPPTNGHALAPAAPAALVRGADLGAVPVLQAIASALEAIAKPSENSSEKWMLTVAEAAAASGWTVTALRRAIKAGTLPAVKDGGWKIRRAHLEDFHS